ncbi:hypothetical protein FOCC_FOCC011386, partial [Frankliniella occidentalis]
MRDSRAKSQIVAFNGKVDHDHRPLVQDVPDLESEGVAYRASRRFQRKRGAPLPAPSRLLSGAAAGSVSEFRVACARVQSSRESGPVHVQGGKGSTAEREGEEAAPPAPIGQGPGPHSKSRGAASRCGSVAASQCPVHSKWNLGMADQEVSSIM